MKEEDKRICGDRERERDERENLKDRETETYEREGDMRETLSTASSITSLA